MDLVDEKTLARAVVGKIRLALAERDWSQAELARQLGETDFWVSRRLSRKQRGKPQELTFTDLERIAVVLECSPEDLIPRVPSDTRQYRSRIGAAGARPAGHPIGASTRPAGRPGPSRPAMISRPQPSYAR